MSENKQPSFREVTENLTMLLDREAAAQAIFGAGLNFPHRYYVKVDEKDLKILLKEFENKVMAYVSEESIDDALIKFTRALSPDFPSKYRIDHAGAVKIRKYWRSATKPFTAKIFPVLAKSTPGYCFNRVDFDPIEMDTPLFDDFIAHVETNPRALMAFIGMLFDPNAPRQFYLWLQGEGADGKGVLCRFLRRLFQGAYTALSSDMKNINQFFTSRLPGKRVGVFQDCHNLSFVRSELFMMLSGGDAIEIEAKGKDPYTTEIETMFIFSSNGLPSISSSKAHQRRAVICKMKERTTYSEPKATYEDRFWEERAGIVYKCIKVWQEMKKELGGLVFDTSVNEEVALSTEEQYEWLFNKLLKPCQEGHVKAGDLYEAIKRIKSLPYHYKVDDFKKWMTRKKGVVVKRRDLYHVEMKAQTGEFNREDYGY